MGHPTERNVVGLTPWLPWPLSTCRWWTEPVRAERLASLRIGITLVLLVDLLTTYLPNLHVFYGQGSLGDPSIFGYRFQAPRWNWSLLKGVGDPGAFRAAMIVWIVATALLLVGLATRLSVVVVWVLSVSFANLNPYNDNAGDQVRAIALFYLMLCPCGAAWSLDAVLLRRLGRRPAVVFVSPWTIRILFIQLALTYYCNGIFKIFGPDWRDGYTLYYVLNDLTLARWSYAQFPMPVELTRLMTWMVLVWEISFPFMMLLPWLYWSVCGALGHRNRLTLLGLRFLEQFRVVMLVFGVLFHLGIFVALELGGFAPYMICLYLPLVPWERCGGRRRAAAVPAGAVVGSTIQPGAPRL